MHKYICQSDGLSLGCRWAMKRTNSVIPKNMSVFRQFQRMSFLERGNGISCPLTVSDPWEVLELPTFDMGACSI